VRLAFAGVLGNNAFHPNFPDSRRPHDGKPSSIAF
jgi:hypothetical protein